MNIKEEVDNFLENLPSQFPENISLHIEKECYSPDTEEPEGRGNGWGPDYAIFVIEIDDYYEGLTYSEHPGYPKNYISYNNVQDVISKKLIDIFKDDEDSISINFYPKCNEWEVYRKKTGEKDSKFRIN